MSLVKSPRRSEKKRAANQRNGQFSRGPATPEGRERIRSRHLRHGFYSHAEGVALRALGEDPKEFQALGERLKQTWNPRDEFQEQLVDCLTRGIWRMKRADRMQDGLAFQQAKEANRRRQARFAQQLVAYRITWANLQFLAGKVAQPGYVTTAADLLMMEDLCRSELKEAGDLPLALFRQLRKPEVLCSESEEGAGKPELTPEEEEAKRRQVMTRIRAIFALPPLPEPEEEETEAEAEESSESSEGEPAAASQADKAKPAPASPPPEEPRRQRVRQIWPLFWSGWPCRMRIAATPARWNRRKDPRPTTAPRKSPPCPLTPRSCCVWRNRIFAESGGPATC